VSPSSEHSFAAGKRLRPNQIRCTCEHEHGDGYWNLALLLFAVFMVGSMLVSLVSGACGSAGLCTGSVLPNFSLTFGSSCGGHDVRGVAATRVSVRRPVCVISKRHYSQHSKDTNKAVFFCIFAGAVCSQVGCVLCTIFTFPITRPVFEVRVEQPPESQTRC